MFHQNSKKMRNATATAAIHHNLVDAPLPPGAALAIHFSMNGDNACFGVDEDEPDVDPEDDDVIAPPREFK